LGSLPTPCQHIYSSSSYIAEELMSSNVQFRNKAPYLAWWLSWTFSSILSLAASQFLLFAFFRICQMLIMCIIVTLLRS